MAVANAPALTVHTLQVLRDDRRPNDRAILWLKCPHCPDLTIHVTVGPASHADRLIDDLTAAHHQQVRERKAELIKHSHSSGED